MNVLVHDYAVTMHRPSSNYYIHFLPLLHTLYSLSLSPSLLVQLCDVLVKELREGVEGTGVKCGVIGETGVSYPMTDFEKRSLQASAKAQQITGTCGAHVRTCTHTHMHYGGMLMTL